MPLSIGTRIGAYEIGAPLGAGGMGEVYRARDSRLGRDVALKVLADVAATDAERQARFEREAQLLAALSHPNIAAIHGVEEANGITALVLELVEGPTLDERVRQGPIAVNDALRIASQLVDALQHAHASGIIHRDLKPANIKLRSDGTVKVLDFGLAKALEPMLDAGDAAVSPTITGAVATREGTVLGTAAYMSPEQARGEPTDRRTDIWAFGCVLFEMLAGSRAFPGKTSSEALAQVMMKEPDWALLPAATPPSIERLLRRSLAKDHTRRLADISDARLEIDDARREPVQRAALVTGSNRRERLGWIATVAILAIVAAVLALPARRAVDPAPPVVVDIATPPTIDASAMAISPDGRKIAFAASDGGIASLWLRSLDSASARPLRGTANARLPFWSPDSRSIAFGAESQLKRIDLDGETVRTLANAPVFLGGAWGANGDILFAQSANDPLMRVPATGGTPVAETRIEPGQGHDSPHFLPDGQRFLFHMVGGAGVGGVHVAELGKEGSQRLVDADTGAVYSAGSLIFVRRDTAYVQRIDLSGMRMLGDAEPLAEKIATTPFANAVFAALSASSAGAVVFRTGPPSAAPTHLMWHDRSGKEIRRVGRPPFFMLNPALSPDERRVALFTNADIYMMDAAGAAPPAQFTFNPGVDFAAVWSPDGTRLVISSLRRGTFNLYEKLATGAGVEEPLLENAENKDATDWSLDGRYLLYRQADAARGYDIWALSYSDRKTFPLVVSPADERNAQFSPDGRWIAYQSNETGNFEIWIQPFSTPDAPRAGKWRVSTSGGQQVRWSRSGDELFYISADNRLMSVPIRPTADHTAIEAGPAQPLFPWPGQDLGRQGTVLPPFSVSRDGQRFLIASAPLPVNAAPLTMILNWRQR